MTNIKNIVKSLRELKSYKQKCVDETNLLYKCIYCKKYLSSNQWSMVLEKYVKQIFLLSKPKNKTSGDGRSVNGNNVEIKISLGCSNGQFNFVQIRPDHKIDYYVLLCYDVYHGDMGKIYWFLCPAKKLYSLLPEYGGYAHGTIKKFGKITSANIYDNNREYSLRPNPYIKPGLWNKLVELFSSNEKTIMKKI